MSEESFTLLLQEQQKATAQTQLTIDQLTAFKSDYESLIPRLEELAKCVSQPALIPFGRKALVHGRLVHTNEILVHLGGGGGGCEHDYFAKLSTHESVGLVRRRIERINSQIQLLQRQKKLIEDRISYTAQLTDKPPRVITSPADYGERDRKGSDEEVEIREDYDSDAEKHWLQEHRKRFQQEKKADIINKPFKKKVSFDLATMKHEVPDSSDSSDIEGESADAGGLSTIYFTHSSNTQSADASTTRSGELCHLSPSEVVDMVVRHGSVQSALCSGDSTDVIPPMISELSPGALKPILKHQMKPEGNSSYGNALTGDIFEHNDETKPISVLSNEPVTRISKFRNSRLHAKIN